MTKNKSRRMTFIRNDSFSILGAINRYSTSFVYLSLFVGIFGFSTMGQNDPANPDRGVKNGASYSISDIETINTTNGNLMLNIPLASLPKGRGQVGGSISLMYNSKLYDTFVDETLDHSNQPALQNFLHVSPTGGWRYVKGNYELRLNNRFETYSPGQCNIGQYAYAWKVSMEMPDGSLKAFRPANADDLYNDGFFKLSPDGKEHYPCPTNSTTYSTSGMVYLSTDGSYIKLVVDYVPNATQNGRGNPWTMYMSGGSKITGGSGLTTKTYDKNGNFVEGLTDQLGRSLSIETNVQPNEDHVTMLGVGGEEILYKVIWKTITFPSKQYETTASVNGIGRGGTSTQSFAGNFRVVDRIILPDALDNLEYEFHYNTESGGTGWGELASVTTPSGATAEYEFSTPPLGLNTDNLLLRYPTEKTLTYLSEYDGGTSSVTDTWTYNIGKISSTITSPDGSSVIEYHGNTSYEHLNRGLVYKSVGSNGSRSDKLWEHQQPPVANNTVNINSFVKTEFTTVADSSGAPTLTKITDHTYDLNGNKTETKEYDWVAWSSVPKNGSGDPTGIPGGATLKRITVNEYLNSPTGDATKGYWHVASPNVRNAVKSTEVQNGSATPFSRTEITYDNAATTANVTSTKVWDSFKGGANQPYSNPLTGSNSISSAVQYDQYGNPVLMTDAKGVQTQIVYGDIVGPNGTVSGLYPTQTVAAYGTPLARTSVAVYDFYTGLVTSATDVDNGVTAATEYDDLGRPLKSIAAVGTPLEIWTRTEYDDVGRRVIVRSDMETKGDGKKVAIQHYDQLGRVRLSRTLENAATEDPTNEQHGIKIQTRYAFHSGSPSASNGEYKLTSNPYRGATSGASSTEPTMGWTVEFESKSGNLQTVETFFSSGLPSLWGSSTTSTGKIEVTKDANTTTTIEEAGKKRRTVTDALGRLIRVDEPDANGNLDSSTSATNYSHDTLGNLTQIIHGGQTRTFTYSSLSRLLTSTNPESGTFQYTYDPNGNLLTKKDARNITTTHTYDAMNRVTVRNYSDSTPDITYTYDDPQVAFSKGKLTKVASSISETSYLSFDVQDRITASRQRTDDRDYAFGYTYNLDDDLATQTYPSGKVVTFDYDASGDLAQVGKVTANGVQVYANSFGYAPHGQFEKLRLGNGKWERTKFNSSRQVTEISLGHSATDTGLWKANYEYGEWNGTALDPLKNNGSLARQTIAVPTIGTATGFTAVQTYTYDTLDRVKSATEKVGETQTWKQTFLYDRFGNKNFDVPNTTTLGLCAAVVCNPTANSANNRLVDYGYDNSGNITTDAEGRTFIYDAENRQITATGNSLFMSYAYDGNGKRVKSHNAVTDQTTIFVYDAGGKLSAEYTINIPPPSTPTISYLTEDALGSVRITTNSFGEIKSRRDFLPFGDELYAGIGNRNTNQKYSSNADDTRQKFATYQRDVETGLDFAQSRYYSPMHGRFTSPDEFKGGPDELFDFEENASDNPTFYADLENPQSLNKYQYGYNNPYKFNDPTGIVRYASLSWLLPSQF